MEESDGVWFPAYEDCLNHDSWDYGITMIERIKKIL